MRRRATRLEGPIGAKLRTRRRKVKKLAARHGLSNIRVFGSVARGEETGKSDVDLLVDVEPGVGLIGLARAQRELEGLLGARVDLVPAGDLKPGVAESVLVESVPLRAARSRRHRGFLGTRSAKSVNHERRVARWWWLVGALRVGAVSRSLSHASSEQFSPLATCRESEGSEASARDIWECCSTPAADSSSSVASVSVCGRTVGCFRAHSPAARALRRSPTTCDASTEWPPIRFRGVASPDVYCAGPRRHSWGWGMWLREWSAPPFPYACHRGPRRCPSCSRSRRRLHLSKGRSRIRRVAPGSGESGPKTRDDRDSGL